MSCRNTARAAAEAPRAEGAALVGTALALSILLEARSLSRSPGSGASSRVPASPRGMEPLGEIVGEQEAKTNIQTPFPQGVGYVKCYSFLHLTSNICQLRNGAVDPQMMMSSS